MTGNSGDYAILILHDSRNIHDAVFIPKSLVSVSFMDEVKQRADFYGQEVELVGSTMLLSNIGEITSWMDEKNSELEDLEENK